jgi:MscS family membrane protein
MADGLPPDQDRLAVFTVDTGDVALLLQRTPREDGELIWKISNATVARTADLYADFGYGPIVERVAAALPPVTILGVELFKWVLAIAGGLATYAVLLLVSWFMARVWATRRALPTERLFAYLRGPISLVVTVLVVNAILYDLGLGVTARRIAEGRTVLILLATWLILATLNLVRDAIVASLRQQRRDAAVVIQRPIFAALKIVIVITAVLTWLDNIGYNVTTLLASLGIGGIAIALALQKPLEDVFGAFTLYNQQPVRIGDFCRFGDKLGTVEEIGLRTTRIRTIGNTVISVPNAKIAGEYLENFSARQKILYNPTLRLRYDTPPEALQRVLQNIRTMLEAHPRVLPQGPRVRFVQIGAHALEIEIFAYLDTIDWAEYLAVAEELNLRVLESVASSGARLALPAQSLVVEQPLAAVK